MPTGGHRPSDYQQTLLADEPTGALDEQTGRHIMDIIKNLNEQGITTIIATHDRDIASSCQRIIQLSDGRIAVVTA
ncbi:MAG: hypothetical protein WC109_00935 [Syntrophomonadaceae bacterium]|nr:hypothetical protein [Syntrophomonadaceae bacterium]MDD4561970.1 hypothetical protein [Syntrophomonadaceae bacterium]